MRMTGAFRRRALPPLALAAVAALASACGSRARPTSARQPADTVAAAPVTARVAHVTIVIMENRDYDDIIGSGAAPYINRQLVPAAALMTNSHATTHPSQPNYLELFSGSTQGVAGDACPQQSSAPNIATQLIAAGKTFRGYVEAMPQNGYTGCSASGGRYRRKHVPWADFTNVPASSSIAGEWAPGADLAIVVPDMCDDMHDCGTDVGDRWLASHLPAILSWDASNDGLLVLTWDEASPDHDGTNRIATLLLGPMIAPGRYDTRIDHDDVLRTVQTIFGLPCLANSCARPGIAGVWK